MATTRTREALVAFVIAACFVEPGLGAVGKTQGIANVSDSGSAQYTIPIWTPPDTGGMQPRLALTYDHRSSNKLLGIGWNISGLSEIRRCSRTWAQDLQARNVRNDSQDRFCLDGRKLRLFAGTYGANGAEYRTEIESFSRVRSYDASPTIGPGYFVVERNDGLKYEYGGTADSRIESVGQNVARAWALNKISDRYGNATLFTYSEDATNGAYRISSIQYTSNPDRSLSPAHVVNFSYEGKPPGEIDIGYVANSQIRELNRLTRIEVLAGATLLRRYQLTYEITLSNTGRSLLKSLQECAGPSSSLDCLAETKFTYQAGGIGLGSQTNTAAAIPSDQFPFAIDVNGDGRDDLIYASGANCTGTWMVMMATTSGGFGSPTPTGGPSAAGCFGAIPIDYNADGKVDLLVPVNGTTWWYMLGGASGLASPIDTGIPASPSGAGVNAAAIDINGDGLEDLVWMDLFAVAIRYRTRDPSGTGTFSSTVTDLWGPMGSGWMLNSNLVQPTGQYSRRRLPDFNGDGKGDLAFANSFSWWDPESQQTMVDSFWDFRFTGGGGAQEPFGPTMQFPRFLDANGDGKDDLLYISNGSLILRFGTGTAFASGAFLGSGSGFNVNQLVVLDSDGDGRDDFIVPHTSGTWYLFRSTGVGATSSNTGIPVSSGWVGATAGDFNSDGLTDVGYVSGGTWVYRMHEGPYPDLLTTATDGFDNACTFEYKPLTAADYTKLATAGFPQQDYAGSLYVVTKYTESNGIGGTYDLESFHYEGARRDLQGRGFLGFAYRSWIDDRDGTAQRRSYKQDFPFIGFVTNARRTQEPSGTVISEVAAVPAAHSYGSGTEARSLPFTSTVTRTEREVGGPYNGNLVRTIVQNNSVDSATGVTYDTTVTVSEPTSGSANGVQAGASYVQRTYQPTASFLNDWTNWCFGRPQEVQQINSHNQVGGGAITRTSSITWDALKCRPTQTKAEPGHAQLQVNRDLGYDNFGNFNSDRTTGIGVTEERTTTAEWDTMGRFPLSVTQRVSPTVSHATHFGWDTDKGLLTSSTDPNNVETGYVYDAFGRLIGERSTGRHEARPHIQFLSSS